MMILVSQWKQRPKQKWVALRLQIKQRRQMKLLHSMKSTWERLELIWTRQRDKVKRVMANLNLIQMIWNSWIQMTTIFSMLRRKRAKNNKRKCPGKVIIEIESSKTQR